MKKMIVERSGKGAVKCAFLSSLNKINQEMKLFSEKYVLYIDSAWVLHVKMCKNVIGDALSKVLDEKLVLGLSQFFNRDDVVIIYSQAFYGAFNGYKKYLKEIIINDLGDLIITLENSDEIIIIGKVVSRENGSVYKYFESKLNETLSHYDSLLNLFKFTFLTEDEKEKIRESILRTKLGEYPVRLSKQLVPNIKKDTNIGLYLDVDNELKREEGDVALLCVNSTNGDLSSFLIYKIIKF